MNEVFLHYVMHGTWEEEEVCAVPFGAWKTDFLLSHAHYCCFFSTFEPKVIFRNWFLGNGPVSRCRREYALLCRAAKRCGVVSGEM